MIDIVVLLYQRFIVVHTDNNVSTVIPLSSSGYKILLLLLHFIISIEGNTKGKRKEKGISK